MSGGSRPDRDAADTASSYKVTADASMPLSRANLVALGLLPILAAACIGPYLAIYGFLALQAGFHDILYIFLPVFIASIVFHEALHGAGYVLFGGAKWRDVSFGMNWKALAPYAHCRAAVPVSGYRGSVMLPGLLLGVAPWIAGLLTGSGALTFYGFIMIAAASGDMIILWLLRGIDGKEMVLDHPWEAGCRVVRLDD